MVDFCPATCPKDYNGGSQLCSKTPRLSLPDTNNAVAPSPSWATASQLKAAAPTRLSALAAPGGGKDAAGLLPERQAADAGGRASDLPIQPLDLFPGRTARNVASGGAEH